MPTYEFECEDGHQFEHRCTISNKPDTLPCPVMVEESYCNPPCDLCSPTTEECAKPAKQVIRTAPPIWIPGSTHQTVLDYPGAKSQKAGHIHTHGYKPATKVQAGYGGVTSTSYRHHDEVANWVKPDTGPRTPSGT